MPVDVIAAADDGFWGFERTAAQSFTPDVRLADGDVVRAGGRDLRAILRPGHSLADTLFVDDRDAIAFVGDHLLAAISSNTEILPEPGDERPRARVTYLDGLRRTAAMPLRRLYTGHGGVIDDHEQLIRARLAEHDERTARVVARLREAPASVWEVGQSLWRDATVRRRPLLVTWEVLGHLDVLAAAGDVHEHSGSDGRASFALSATRAA